MHAQDFPAPVRAIAQLIVWLLVKPKSFFASKKAPGDDATGLPSP